MVQLGDTGFRFLPVVRKLFLPRHTALQLCQLRQELLERLALLLVFAVRQGIEAHDSPIQTDHRGCQVQRGFDFTLGLNGYEPLAAGLANGDVFSFTFHEFHRPATPRWRPAPRSSVVAYCPRRMATRSRGKRWWSALVWQQPVDFQFSEHAGVVASCSEIHLAVGNGRHSELDGATRLIAIACSLRAIPQFMTEIRG